MLVLNSIRKAFKNVAEPEKVFRKSFIAAAAGIFVASYSTAGYFAWDSITTEWNQENFQASRLFPWVLAYNHGANVAKAIAVSYIGDLAAIYAGAGIMFWHKKAHKKQQKPPQQTLENL
jgi:hypothetical protein